MPAGLERALQRGQRRLVLGRLGEQLGRHAHAVARGPLEQLGAVEAVLPVGAVDREASLVDPAVDRLLGDAEQSRGVPDHDLDPHRPLSARESAGAVRLFRAARARLSTSHGVHGCGSLMPCFSNSFAIAPPYSAIRSPCAFCTASIVATRPGVAVLEARHHVAREELVALLGVVPRGPVVRELQEGAEAARLAAAGARAARSRRPACRSPRSCCAIMFSITSSTEPAMPSGSAATSRK